MYHGKGSQSMSLSCFQDLLALVYKYKTSLGISLVGGKKAMEAKWRIIWIGFGTNVSVLESKINVIVTILFDWYFSIQLTSVQCLLYGFKGMSKWLIF